MSKHRWRDFDDGFDEESLLEDEQVKFERIVRQRAKKSKVESPRDLGGRKTSRRSGTTDDRRELASVKAWGTPY
jgi:hypothetical protein